MTAFVADLVTPLIAASFRKPSFSSLTFTINNSQFDYGAFVNALLSFVLVAIVLFFLVIKPANAPVACSRRQPPPDPTTRNRPECLSEIPLAPRSAARSAASELAAAYRAGRARR
jgi:large conductance mechanosensitive channel